MTTAIALSAAELAELASCETVIEHGLKVFQAVGVALITIREKRLYRADFATFEAYCAARWGFSDRQALRLMSAAEVVNNLTETRPIGRVLPGATPTMVGVLPANEAQVRPLTALPPEQQRAAWQQAVETAPNGKITGAHVEQVAQQYKPMPVHRPAAVRPATEGVEPDLDEDGEPLVDHINRNINDRLAEQVNRDEEDEDEGFRLGDIVEFRGHRCTVIAVMSSGNISVRTPIGQPLHSIDPDVEVVTLIERAPERPAAPRLPTASAVPTPPAKPAERLIPVVDGLRIDESHPVGYAALYATDDAIGYGKATCSACGQTHNGWTPIPAGRWKCRCGETTNDDQLETSGREEYELEQRVKRNNGHKPTIAPLMTSDTPEWYTPADIIVLVRNVLGTIDLDPASCAEANKVVQAKTYYDEAHDGLAQSWRGRVYLNPPYGDEIKAWVKRLVQDYSTGNIKEAILLVPSRSDTEWYRLLREYPRCLVHGRLKFWGNGSSAGAPFPSAVFYLGNSPRTFVKQFSSIGDIYRLWDEGDES